jgi:hypothetical protein
MASNLRVAELDFDAIKENLKTFLRAKPEFTDYDFEGSGLSVMIDLLAYNTHYNAVIGNMLVQEMFLDTAVKRQSIGLISKRLGYTPRSKAAPMAKVTLEVFPTDTPSTLTIGKGAAFNARLSYDTVVTFVTRDAYTINRSTDGRYVFSNVNVYEGSNDIFRYVVSGLASQRFEIPSTNVDTSLLRVYVQKSISDTTTVEWNRFDKITGVGETTTAYFLKYNENGKYEVYFGDGVIGKQIEVGNVIKLDYISTNGALANGASKITFNDTVEGNTNFIVTSIVPAFGGAEEEGIESIRVNAQNSALSQNRAVTESDYIAEINKIFPNDSVAVYGGETLSHPIYGKVFISIKQAGTTNPLSYDQKVEILNHLKQKTVLSITHEFVDPEYIYIVINTDVHYKPNATELSASTLKTLVTNKINQYATDNLNTFKSSFEFSKFVATIDSADSSIVGNNTRFFLKKRRNVVLGANSDYQFDFYITIEESNSKEYTVTSNAFRLAELPGVDCRLMDVDGVMKVYYLLNGIPVTLIDDVGTIDYETGTISLKLNIAESIDGYLELTVESHSALLIPGRNNILTLDSNNLTITMVAS